MGKNTKKKNAIRFGAIAVAALLFLGVFSAWALGDQATATGEIGEIEVDGLEVTPGANDGELLLEDSIAGRPGTVNAAEEDPFELYQFGEDTDEALEANYTATVYLINGAELLDAGMRYLTLDMELNNTDTEEIIDSGTLTLENGRTTFTFDGNEQDVNQLVVNIVGGSYSTHPFAEFNDEEVEFSIDVEPGALNND